MTTVQGTLNVDEAVTMDATLDVTGDASVSTFDSSGETSLATGSGSVTVASSGAMTTVKGTLNVDEAVTMDATLDVTGTANVDGDFSVNTDKFVVTAVSGNTAIAGTTTSEGDLTVNANSDLNGTLNVEGDATFQEDVIVEDNVFMNTAGNSGTVLTIDDANGQAAITVTTSVVNVQNNQTSTTLTVPSLVVEESANYTGDMSIGGNLSVTNNVTAATAPTVGSHLTNKDYVDAQITTAITSPEMFSYDATASSSNNDVIYYINGDLLVYATEMSTNGSSNYNYTITLTGSNLDQVQGGTLRARGNAAVLDAANYDWAYDVNTDAITFDIDYNTISALAGAQVDGYVSCSLTFEYGSAGAEKNSGLTMRFYLDSSNAAATASDFQE
jgi:cytoskeletal protein CcmA (bactofilin family)